MRIIALKNLRRYGQTHPNARVSLERWYATMEAAEFETMADVQAAFSKAKVLNADRVRFEVSGGEHRLIAAFHFRKKLVFIKFIGTHAEYDKVDALTVRQF